MEGRNAWPRRLAPSPGPGQGFPPPRAAPLLLGVLETHVRAASTPTVHEGLRSPGFSHPPLLFLSALAGNGLTLKPAHCLNI